MTIVYTFQIFLLASCIPLLAFCIYMIHRSRLALNGLYRGLTLLLSMLIGLIVLLIVRRLDDMLLILDSTAILILSSVVMLLVVSMVIIVTMDIHFLYRNRALYTMWQMQRKKRIDEMETMYEKGKRIDDTWST